MGFLSALKDGRKQKRDFTIENDGMVGGKFHYSHQILENYNHFQERYPLVDIQKTVEHHHFIAG